MAEESFFLGVITIINMFISINTATKVRMHQNLMDFIKSEADYIKNR